jgi:hypothetical protein
MFKLLLCHRRTGEMSRHAFQAYWRDRRSQLAIKLQSRLGFVQYGQTHQISRWNLLYQGARASRSWVVTSPLAALDGTTVPPPWARDRSAKPDAAWDVVEALGYPSEQAAVAALASSAGTDALRRLADDQAPRTRRTVSVVTETHVPARDPHPPVPQVSLLFFLQSREKMTRREMLDYWETDHEELFLSLQDAMGYREYEQMHVRSPPSSVPLETLGTNAGASADGIARITYADLWTMGLRGLHPAALLANVRLIRDETTFADLQRSTLVLGREYQFKTSGPPHRSRSL